MRILIKWILLASGGLASHAYSASFDCNLAKTDTEHTICINSSVNDADVKMATTYTILNRLVPMGTRSEIRDEQVKWLKLRDQCGKSVSCLLEVYKMRQQKLEIYLERIYRQGPF
jgi:uncharacterized protein